MTTIRDGHRFVEAHVIHLGERDAEPPTRRGRYEHANDRRYVDGVVYAEAVEVPL